MGIESMAEFFQSYGAWGMCAVLVAGIAYIYKSQTNLLEKRNDQFIEVLKEVGVLLQSVNDSNTRLGVLMTANNEHLRDSVRVLERVENHLNRED